MRREGSPGLKLREIRGGSERGDTSYRRPRGAAGVLVGRVRGGASVGKGSAGREEPPGYSVGVFMAINAFPR